MDGIEFVKGMDDYELEWQNTEQKAVVACLKITAAFILGRTEKYHYIG
jgi:hypothetical protein